MDFRAKIKNTNFDSEKMNIISPFGRDDSTSSAALPGICGRSLPLHALQLAAKANSSREIFGLPRFALISCFILMAAGFGCGSTYSMLQKDKLTFFYLKQPDAKQVVFTCSLDGFDPRPAKQVNNIWVVKVPSDKSFQFYYLVDGKIFLPPCKNREMDDFGGENCIFNP